MQNWHSHTRCGRDLSHRNVGCTDALKATLPVGMWPLLRNDLLSWSVTGCKITNPVSTLLDLKTTSSNFNTKTIDASYFLLFCLVAMMKWCRRLLRRCLHPSPPIESSQWPVLITGWKPSISDPDDNQKQINRWPCCQDTHQYSGLLLSCNDVITHELHLCS